MKCAYCGKEVILAPTAAQRSAQTGIPASFYIRMFPHHADCYIKHRSAQSVRLMRQIAAGTDRLTIHGRITTHQPSQLLLT